MYAEEILVVGLVLGALGFPAVLSAFGTSGSWRIAFLLLIGSASCLAYALTNMQGGVTFTEVPGIVIRVVKSVF